MKRIFIAFLISLGGCVSAPKVSLPRADRISVMTYNVENLFDLDDDPKTQDETFLPPRLKATAQIQNKCRVQNNSSYRLSECLEKQWTEPLLKRKLRRLADVVAQVNSGRGPDILIVQEIENRKVLEMWRDGYMKDMNYQTISHIDGPDERGIDTAVLSRLPLIDPPVLHEIDFSSLATQDNPHPRPSRGILESHLRLPNGQTLTVYAVHLPSQGAPTPFRRQALKTLLGLIQKLKPEDQFIAGGDFNITAKEEWKEHLVGDMVAKDYVVSHLVGCKDCTGSIYYPRDKTWSFFDILFFPKAMAGGGDTWQLDSKSIHLVNTSVFQVNRFGTPARFGSGKGSVGVSDHWPMYAELHLKSEGEAQ